MSGGSKASTVGWRYYFSLFMGLGRGPIDALREIRVGERSAWRGNAIENTTINIDAPNLFGGEEKEGGIQGPLQVLMGEPTQVATPQIVSAFGAPQPGFRGVVTAFFDGLLSMNNPYPKPWKFRINRVLKGWDGPVFEPALAQIPLGVLGEGDFLYNSVAMQLPFTQNAQPTLESIYPVRVLLIATTGSALDPIIPSYNNNGMLVSNAAAFLCGIWEVGLYRLDGSEQYLDISAHQQASVRAELRDWTLTPTMPRGNFNISISLTLPPIGFGGYSVSGSIAHTWHDGVFQFLFTVITQFDTTTTYLAEIPLGTMPGFDFRAVVDNENPSVRFYLDETLIYTYVAAAPQIGASFTGLYIGGACDNAGGHNICSYRVRNIQYTLSEQTSAVGANGSHIIYETMTNRKWGRGLARTKLDETSFRETAVTLYDEKFPLCMKWLRQDELKSFIQNVQNHIGSVIYTHRQTGLINLKLIRGDYEFDDLPVYDMSNGLIEIREATVNTVSRGVNAVNVKWHDPFEDTERSVTVKNAAAIQMAGGAVNATTKTYNGCPLESIALRLGQRDLRASSTLVRRFTLVANRNLSHLHPGDVFAMQDPERGIPKMAVRVGKVKDGTLRDGKIVLDVIQDVFSLPSRTFASGAPSTHVPQDNSPCIDHQRVFEAPYFMLAGRMTPADLDYVSDDGGYLAVVNSRGKSTNVSVQIAVRDGLSTPDDEPPNENYFCGG